MTNPTLDQTRARVERDLDGLTDYSGLLIYDHCARVEASCPPWFPERSRHVALMHDVVEDTDRTLESLRACGYEGWIIEQLDCITQRKGESYPVYIERLIRGAHPDTILVKILDNRDNLSPWRMVTLDDERAAQLHRRYDGLEAYLVEAWKRKR